ncbi:MAG: winged helix-turn-helix transcriptional regulator [Nocardioidaceae bacterium]|nr:winged helix-turn-helix transcriptional regulator [Nocardioidaceae bacterium]
MTQPRWLNDEEARVWRSHLQMHRQLARVLGQRLTRDSGLSSADYEIMVPLSEASGEQLRARDLAATVDWEKSRLSHHLTRMQQRGLVERRECPTDGRGAFIALTATGRSAIEAAAPQHVDAVRENFIDLLTEHEIDVLATITDRVLDHLKQEDPPCDPDGGVDQARHGDSHRVTSDQ